MYGPVPQESKLLILNQPCHAPCKFHLNKCSVFKKRKNFFFSASACYWRMGETAMGSYRCMRCKFTVILEE